RDSLSWGSAVKVDSTTALEGGGRASSDAGAWSVAIDSLAIHRGKSNWRLEPGAQIGSDPSGWVARGVKLRREGGPDLLTVDGGLTPDDSGGITATIENLSLAELE